MGNYSNENVAAAEDLRIPKADRNDQQERDYTMVVFWKLGDFSIPPVQVQQAILIAKSKNTDNNAEND